MWRHVVRNRTPVAFGLSIGLGSGAGSVGWFFGPEGVCCFYWLLPLVVAACCFLAESHVVPVGLLCYGSMNLTLVCGSMARHLSFGGLADWLASWSVELVAAQVFFLGYTAVVSVMIRQIKRMDTIQADNPAHRG